jgi:hypothetical protein
MNAFTNPKNRGVSLPGGAKDLVNVLRSIKPKRTKSKSQPGKGFLGFILLGLLQSRDRGATEFVVEPESEPDAESNVAERIQGTWHQVMTIPAGFRSAVITGLVEMAAFTGDEFPGVGLIALKHKGKRLMWRIDMELVHRNLSQALSGEVRRRFVFGNRLGLGLTLSDSASPTAAQPS